MLLRTVIALLVLAPAVVLVVGSVRGRVRVRACCPPPEQDLRIASALRDTATTTSPLDGGVLATARRPG